LESFYTTCAAQLKSEEFINSMRYMYMLNYLWLYRPKFDLFKPDMDFGKMVRHIANTYIRFNINKRALLSELSKEVVKKGIRGILRYILEEYYLTDKYKELDLENNNNLRNRKIKFLERLLSPFYLKIQKFIQRASRETELNKSSQIDSIVNSTVVISEFLKNGNYYYDFPTPYFGIRGAQILNYSGDENLPTNSRLLHQSQYNIICPIATSSQKPGVVLHSVPETPLDHFGHFKEVFKPL